jgi:hypothetical protein
LRKLFLRLGRLVGLIVLVAGLGVLAMLNWTQVMFGHHMSQDNLELWSDRPFTIASGREVLENIEQRLSRSPLPQGKAKRRIFIVNSDWRRYLLFLNRPNAGGLNYFPLTSNVFIRAANVETGQVVGPSGHYVRPPRTLAYFAAHEIGHSLIGERIGIWQHALIPVWLNEGLADYIAFSGAYDLEKMTALFKSGDKSMDPTASGLYLRYRLMVTHALQQKSWTLDQLLHSRLSQEEAETELLPPR